MEQIDNKKYLRLCLEQYGLEITSESDRIFQINKFYEIELERNNLYKLICNGQVVAPFSDIG